MINQEKIKEWVRTYLKHIQEVSVDVHVSKEEGYKFASIDNFQKYFNLEDPDLLGMLEKSIINNNLVVGAQYWPRKMLLLYAQDYPEETRSALRNLFDESKEIYTRITETDKIFSHINEIRSAKLEATANTYIGLRFLSLLLGFRFPNKYNALKPSEWKFFTRFIDPDFLIPIHTTAGEQYRFYEPYIEALRIYIKDREEIQSIKKLITKGLSFDDSESHWMTQDIIYVTARVLAEERSEQKTETVAATQENDEEASSIEDIISTEENDTGFMPLEKHLEEYIMKNWDIVDFGEKLSLYREDDGTPGQQYMTDVGIIDILAKDAQGNFVVIELKRAESKYHVLGQVLNYMTWVQKNLALNNEKVRGMIVVGKADNTLKSAIEQVSDKVILKEYRIKMTFADVK
jgi:RecB family endonuclease NucS